VKKRRRSFGKKKHKLVSTRYQQQEELGKKGEKELTNKGKEGDTHYHTDGTGGFIRTGKNSEGKKKILWGRTKGNETRKRVRDQLEKYPQAVLGKRLDR